MLPTPTREEIDWGAEAVRDAFAGAAPCFIGRNGTVELESLFFWYTHRAIGGGAGAPAKKPWPQRLLDTMSKNAGVWPATEASLDAWASAYATALGALDGLAAGWYAPFRQTEAALLAALAPQAFTTPLRSLEPYYVAPGRRWTAALAGKRVTVVTSFAETVQRQADKFGAARRIWAAVEEPETILPQGVFWNTVRTYYAPAIAQGDLMTSWPAGSVPDWQTAVTWTVQRCIATRPDVAIVGCGGLGMLIGAGLKRAGIKVIVLGGATQVLFGIKGARWENHDIISGFWNDDWVWPCSTETPAGAAAIEGACYWRAGRPPTPVPEF